MRLEVSERAKENVTRDLKKRFAITEHILLLHRVQRKAQFTLRTGCWWLERRAAAAAVSSLLPLNWPPLVPMLPSVVLTVKVVHSNLFQFLRGLAWPKASGLLLLVSLALTTSVLIGEFKVYNNSKIEPQKRKVRGSSRIFKSVV